MNVALRPNYISLFAGVGGLELAVRLALPAARCVCYVEREVEAAGILAARLADKALDDAPIWSDVSTFDGKPWRGLVDGIVGGFPCQDLSVAGKREGIKRGNRSGLFYEYARIIREVEPRWVYIENVPAVLAFPAGGIVLGELASMGFDAEWGSLRASDVGASHQRHRKFILAYRRCERDERRRILRDVFSTQSATKSERDQWQRLRFDSRDGSFDVADCGSERRGKSAPEESAQRTHVGDRGEDVEQPSTAKCGGFRERLRLSGAIRESCTGKQRVSCPQSLSEAEAGRGELVNADFSDDNGCGFERSGRRIESPVAGSELVFAPGPGTAIWNDVLVRDYGMRPALSQAEAESCVRRVADGLASPLDQRIDRLRGCGNGVVAVQGAVALRELMRRVERLD